MFCSLKFHTISQRNVLRNSRRNFLWNCQRSFSKKIREVWNQEKTLSNELDVLLCSIQISYNIILEILVNGTLYQTRFGHTISIIFAAEHKRLFSLFMHQFPIRFAFFNTLSLEERQHIHLYVSIGRTPPIRDRTSKFTAAGGRLFYFLLEGAAPRTNLWWWWMDSRRTKATSEPTEENVTGRRNGPPRRHNIQLLTHPHTYTYRLGCDFSF